jgi:hypothetical protein
MDLGIAMGLFHFIDYLSGEGITTPEQIEIEIRKDYPELKFTNLRDLVEDVQNTIAKAIEEREKTPPPMEKTGFIKSR